MSKPKIYDVIATGTTEPRDIRDRFSDIINVKDFGAKGDGSTDDTTAFNNFLTYLTTNGGYGLVPVGTYAINPVTRNLTGGKSFTIRGADRVGSVLKNNIPDSSFIYLTGCSNCAIENLTVDGNYTDVPYGGSGAHIGLVNTNDFTLRDVLITRFRRVAVLAYNDHQTTTTNVYNRLILERVTVLGNSNYVNGVGPSAMVVADYNNSVMRDCYIENIGLYGYEYKNDCSNTLIEGCVAVNVYHGIYYGGNGDHTELRYVKNSLATDCVLVDCTNPITTGNADNNVFSNIESRTTTSGPTPSRATISLESSNDNRAFGIHISGRKKVACDIRNSTGNSVEFSLNDGEYTGDAVVIAAGASDNSVTIEWKNHDTKILKENDYPGQNQVVDVRAKYYHRTASETYPLIEDGLSPTRPPFYSTVSGRVQYGTTFDTYTITGQPSLCENVGDYTSTIRRRLRHKFDSGSQVETIYSADMLSSVSYIKEPNYFYPLPDNAIKLGAPGGRWAQLYAGTTTISTSDGREKQQVRELTDRERAVASHLKSLLRAFKFNDAVEKRGDAARLHFGIIAQDVKAAFEAEGLVAEDYALLCYDEWDEVPEERDENGLVVQQHIDAGNRYGVRYEELLAFIIAAL